MGDHILLGGDNMDLALALVVSQKLAGHNLDAWQQRSLWHACRAAKEALLRDATQDSATVTILGRGSKVIGSSISTDVTRSEIKAVIEQGFFSPCALGDRPARAKQTGLQEIGLPYAADAAVTRHLAGFC